MLALGQLYDGLRAADEIVAKAVGVREVARIARIETLLRKYVYAESPRLRSRGAERVLRAGLVDLAPRRVDKLSETNSTVHRRKTQLSEVLQCWESRADSAKTHVMGTPGVICCGSAGRLRSD